MLEIVGALFAATVTVKEVEAVFGALPVVPVSVTVNVMVEVPVASVAGRINTVRLPLL
jgi:hypothetical protein